MGFNLNAKLRQASQKHQALTGIVGRFYKFEGPHAVARRKVGEGKFEYLVPKNPNLNSDDPWERAVFTIWEDTNENGPTDAAESKGYFIRLETDNSKQGFCFIGTYLPEKNKTAFLNEDNRKGVAEGGTKRNDESLYTLCLKEKRDNGASGRPGPKLDAALKVPAGGMNPENEDGSVNY